MLDFSHDGFENSFRNALDTGLSIFCGAGFSVEAKSTNGRRLPVGSELFDELKQRFPSVREYESLPWACTTLVATDREMFHEYLRDRFTVGEFDPSYDVLPKLPLRNIYTTNIDDLLPRVYDASDMAVTLQDRALVGASYGNSAVTSVGYHPLHGSVTHSTDDYVFGADEIASAFAFAGESSLSWRTLARDTHEQPILFWGWNFNDAGPIRAMFSGLRTTNDNPNRWALIPDPTPQMKGILQSIGFCIIVGDTKGMLEYLNEYVASRQATIELSSYANVSRTNGLEAYRVPANDNTLTSYHLKDFFVELSPRWSHIYSGDVPMMSSYKRVADAIASGQDVIVIGMHGSGKTTLMMQLATSYKTLLPKHYMVAPHKTDVMTYLKKLGGTKSILFVDDCFRDTDAVIELLSRRNVQTVFFARDHSYESQCYKLRRFSYKLVDVTEIKRTDGQAIIDAIPRELRHRKVDLRNFEKNPTILWVLAISMYGVNFKFLKKFYEEDPDAARVFLMITYVHFCGTPCSFDMVYSFLGDDSYSWEEMLGIVDRIGSLVCDASDGSIDGYNAKDGLQDYYACRSPEFARRIIHCIQHPKNNADDSSWYGEENKLLADVLMNFAQRVMPYKVCSYDAFKRKCCDSDLAVRAFACESDGEEFYNLYVERDESEYVYQQAALYFSELRNYRKAFDWIDRAYNLARINRFAIDATRAQISFDANLDVDEGQSRKALESLNDCCKNDQRKATHFLAYAVRCLRFCSRYPQVRITEHLRNSLEYIDEALEKGSKLLGRNNMERLSGLRPKLKNALERQSKEN